MDRRLSAASVTSQWLLAVSLLLLSCTGCDGAGTDPEVAVDPSAMEFGTVIVGTFHEQTLSLRNQGDADLVVSSVTLQQGDQGFSVESFTGTIAPGATKTLAVEFYPADAAYAEAGALADVVVVVSDAANEPTVEVPLSADDVTVADFRAIHTGVNAELYRDVYEQFLNGFYDPLDDYFDFLGRVDARWVGLSVAPIFDTSLGTSFERLTTSGGCVNTWDDTVLGDLVDAFHGQGYYVYLTIGLAAKEPNCLGPHRSCLGWTEPVGSCADYYDESDCWWDPDHADHADNVAEFWSNYTTEAVHYAEIAAAHGVEMFSLGTETDGLFRHDPNAPGNYHDEIDDLITEVRSVYPRGIGYTEPMGYLTYDMHYTSYTEQDEERLALWDHEELDVIGVSAYIPILELAGVQVPEQGDPPLDPAEYSDAWEYVYSLQSGLDGFLEPTHEDHPDKPIVFLEMGYWDGWARQYCLFSIRSWIHEDEYGNTADGDGPYLHDISETTVYDAFHNWPGY